MNSDPKQKTVKQHFVPQRYLREFKDGSGVLWVYDKRNGKVFPSGERAVAFEKAFYDFPPGAFEGGYAEEWNAGEYGEKLMSVFEQEQARVLDLLLSEGPHIGIRRDMKEAASFVMTIQFMRTSSYRRRIAEQQTDFLETLARQMVSRNFPGSQDLTPRITPTEAALRQLHMRALTDYDRWQTFCRLLESHHWMFCIARDGASFVTSDNPVSRRPHLSHLGTNYTGIGSKGIEIVYALSGRYALLLRERSFHELPEEHDRGRLLLSDDGVDRLNRVVAANCDRFLFGASSDYAQTDGFFEANPTLRERPWERWATKFGRSRRAKIGARDKRHRQQEIESYLEHIPIEWDPP